MVPSEKQEVWEQATIDLRPHTVMNFLCGNHLSHFKLILKMDLILAPIAAVFANLTYHFISIHKKKWGNGQGCEL